jgi:predicted DCC family thiol-disulfide oxidoreductase YuxK
MVADQIHSPIRQFTNSPIAPIILFDGVCNLCNASVQFVIARDPRARFRFGALQSEAAAACLQRLCVQGALTDSVVLIENDRIYTRSTAALRIARGLRFPWPVAFLLIAVPRPLRDWVYDFVARRRYRWFGKRDACMVPTPALRDRFLSDSPHP